MTDIFAVHSCTSNIIRAHGSLHAMKAWVALPTHLGKCWQIVLWRTK